MKMNFPEASAAVHFMAVVPRCLFFFYCLMWVHKVLVLLCSTLCRFLLSNHLGDDKKAGNCTLIAF